MTYRIPHSLHSKGPEQGSNPSHTKKKAIGGTDSALWKHAMGQEMGALVANKSLESGFFSLLTYNSTRGCTKEGGKKGGKKTPKIKNLQPKSTPPRPLADPTSQKCRQFFFFPKLEFWKQLITYMYEMIRI